MGSKTGGRPSAFSAELHARDSAIRTVIGRMIRAQYDVAEPLPKQLVNLVKRLDGVDARRHGSGSRQTRSAPGTGVRPIPKREPVTA
jgi:hypothetical protein